MPLPVQLRALNLQLAATGEITTEMVHAWLWGSDPEEPYHADVLLNRNQLLGLMVCRCAGRPRLAFLPVLTASLQVQVPGGQGARGPGVLRREPAHDDHGQAGAAHDVARAQGHGGQHPAGVARLPGPAAGELALQAEPAPGPAPGEPVCCALRQAGVPGRRTGGPGRRERDPAVPGPGVCGPDLADGRGAPADGGVAADHVPAPAPAGHVQQGATAALSRGHLQVPLRGQQRRLQPAVHAHGAARRGPADVQARLPGHVQPRLAGILPDAGGF